MKTDELIDLLAAGAEPVDARLPIRRYGAALALGTAIATVLMLVQLGINPALEREAATAMFWIKLAFVATLFLAAAILVVRLGRPGAALGPWPSALLAPVVAIWLLGIAVLMNSDPQERASLLFGQTWRECSWNIAMLSAPVLVAALWALKGLAPTRLRLAGAATGALAGAAGATIYALHCPELAAPFLAIWYVIGILIPTAAGALVGPQVLRW